MSQFLMQGHVYHSRSETAQNSFKYPIFNLYFSVDAEKDLKHVLQKKFFNFLQMKGKDYLSRKSDSLFDSITTLLKEKFDYKAEKIFLQTIPRMFGYTFNPINFWYCFNGNILEAVLCEVNNTFGESHCYWLFQDGKDLNGQWLKAQKEFHVSPFFAVEGEYHFRFQNSRKHLHVDILFLNADGKNKLNTWVKGDLTPLINSSALSLLFKYGWMTPLVVLRIHYQAVKLFFKKVKFYTKPDPPKKEITYESTFIRR